MKRTLLLLIISTLATSCAWNSEQDLYPETNCDGTTDITFSGSIQPILTARCLSCHSASNAVNLGGGVKLDTYENVKTRASNGSLLGVIKHQSGYPQMPQGSSKLSSCQISLIEQWINLGTLNN